ncbi:GNAT family N-acetyltransferase [Paenibacillus tundrae]|uniref:GNAT superfamily N-acetyltransferase n=1 Tax=Paenibacillus tundrae TaxID=528187 RepID=A0ABT9WJN3_9BACL|nr:GNAT family N-acetyltransferase [Paenibacillus tundrae]MDQ0173254.1 GNAT superfamily N-acetyltransferase [Paenibacillus tundrae]
MSLDVTIRHSSPDDLPDLVILMDQLGYPTTYTDMLERYTYLASDPSYTTLVAELNGRAVGMIGLQTFYMYEQNGRHCRIAALVVHQQYRGTGIGRLLIQAAEHWASVQGMTTVSLNSGNRPERKVAHEFYAQMGYTAGSTGFRKRLTTLQHQGE